MRQNNRKASPLASTLVLLSILFFNLPLRVSLVLLATLLPAGIIGYVLYQTAKRGQQPREDRFGEVPPAVYGKDYSSRNTQEAYDLKERYSNRNTQEAYDTKERYSNRNTQEAYDTKERYSNRNTQEAYDLKERHGRRSAHDASMEYIELNQDDDARRLSELKVLLGAGIIDRAEYNERLRTLKDR